MEPIRMAPDYPDASFSGYAGDRSPDRPGRPGEADDANLGDDTAPVSNQAAEGAWKPAIAVEPAGRRDRLRQAAQVLLDAWDGLTGSKHNVIDALAGPIDNLRAALATKTLASAKVDPSRTTRNTKQTQVLAMLRRNEGASGPQSAEAMGWAPHTVRGFLAGLAKKGITVDVLERVRQVGTDKQGTKGSYTVYRVSCEGGVRHCAGPSDAHRGMPSDGIRMNLQRRTLMVRSPAPLAGVVDFLRKIDAAYRADTAIRLILDNHSAHISEETRARLVTMPQGRFSFVFTPKHGSWLNLVEGLFRTGHSAGTLTASDSLK
jgi:hypothetical protein